MFGVNLSQLSLGCTQEEQPGGSWQCPAPPVQSKGPCSVLVAVLKPSVYLSWMGCTHTHTHTRQMMAHVMPQILKPYTTLLFNVAGSVRASPWMSTCPIMGTLQPQRGPQPQPLPVLPSQRLPCGELPPVFTVVRNLLKRLFCL